MKRLVRVAERHPYLATGCALSTTKGALRLVEGLCLLGGNRPGIKLLDPGRVDADQSSLRLRCGELCPEAFVGTEVLLPESLVAKVRWFEHAVAPRLTKL